MPNRAPELVWDEPEDAARRRDAAGSGGAEGGGEGDRRDADGDGAGRGSGARGRGALTRAAVVRAALELADAEGLDAVSIRRVAGALGARPMSLYTHIASKDDLIALMLDALGGELLVPEPLPDDGREALRRIARRAFDAYLAHPWMLHAFGRGPRVGPNQLRRAEQSATAVARLGVPPDDAWAALSIVHEWTIGHAIHVITLREDDQLEQQLRAADPAAFPRTARVFPGAGDASPQATFEAALDVVLDGIAARFAQG